MKTIDPQLNLSSQAWAVLHMLEDHHLETNEESCIDTSAFYNGRERGFVVSVRRSWTDRNALHLAVAESRNSDHIVVIEWEGLVSINPPVVDDITDKSWNDRVSFAWGDCGKAAHHVQKRILQFLESHSKLNEKSK